MIPKLIYFDIDGTLVNKAGVITQGVKDAVAKVKGMGTRIAFASGRPSFAAFDLMKEIGVDAPSAFFSSSVIYDPTAQKVVQQWNVDPADGAQVLAALEEADLYTELHTADAYYITEWTELSDMHLTYVPQRPVVKPLPEVMATLPVVKICVVAHKGEEEAKARALKEKFSQFHYGIATGASHDDIIFMNATNPEASREIVFAQILKELGINASEVMSFGDGESDRVFISLAGIGVAMGNAPDVVKMAANYVTSSVEDEGVRAALDRLVFTPSGL